MKKLLLFFAFAAVVFAGCDGVKNTGSAASDAPLREVGASDIAFIRMDSLVSNYNRYIDFGDEFEVKATKIQSDLESRARRLQSEVADLEDKASKGLMTRSQIATTQEQLQNKAAAFENDRQSQLTELAEQEQVMTNQVMNAINEYIAQYNKDLRYKLILSTSGGVPVLHADPAMDITREILDGLNAEYAAETATK